MLLMVVVVVVKEMKAEENFTSVMMLSNFANALREHSFAENILGNLSSQAT